MVAAASVKPIFDIISAAHFDALMSQCAPFEQSPSLAIAVSGGADSMALLLLAHEWATQNGGNIMALTVDHGLRAESATEATTVKGWCKARGIEHQILRWHSSEIDSAMPAQARDARYELMTGWCKDHHILHLLTAHHQGDQAETLLMRTARGSFLEGLACMPTITDKDGIRLLRPLLSVAKSQLIATLESMDQEWLEDPTNQKLEYTRNFIRSELDEGLNEKASGLVESFGKARNLLEYKLADQLNLAISLYPPGYAHLAEIHDEQTLSHLIQTLSGESYSLRSEKLTRLHADLQEHPTRRTAAGLLFTHQPDQQRWLVTREDNAVDVPIILAQNTSILWDQRFLVSWSNPPLDTDYLTVRALGRDGLAQLDEAKFRLPSIEKAVFLTIPSFWYLEQLLCVPHIAYTHPGENFVCTARFMPAKPLAGRAFSGMNIPT